MNSHEDFFFLISNVIPLFQILNITLKIIISNSIKGEKQENNTMKINASELIF